MSVFTSSFVRALYSPLGRTLPDEVYLRLLWRARMGSRLCLDNPKTYNEKLQWLKLHFREESCTKLVDKVAVKDWVANRIGKEYVVRTLGVWASPDDIDEHSLTGSFVLKCSHDSGSVILCEDASSFDWHSAKASLRKSLKRSTYWKLREWPYKDVEPRILAEELLPCPSGNALVDYKVLCFNGTPRLIEVHRGRRGAAHTQDFLWPDWSKSGISQPDPAPADSLPEMPPCLDEMLCLSAVISAGFPHIRVDWYVIDGSPVFGELTFFDGSGFAKFDKKEDDLLLGSWIDLDGIIC